jgi:hypothetical protein
MEIVLVDADEPAQVRVTSLDKLLPEQFGDAALIR